MRRPFLAAALLAAALAIARAAEPVRVSLQLRWDHQFQFAGYYAADWMGYYEEEGLSVEIRPSIRNGEILQAVREVSEGRADFGIGAADVLVGIDRGDPLVIVSSFFQKSGAAYFALESTPLESLADLARLTLARLPNDLIDIEFQAAFREEGIRIEGLASIPLEAGFEDMTSGRAGALPGYVITFPFALEQAGIRYRYLTPAQFGINFYGDSVFTTSAFLGKRRATVDAFVRASIKGWVYALEHPREIAEIIARDLPNTSFRGDVASYNRFQAREVPKLMEYPVVEPGHVNPGRWQAMYDHLLRLGIVDHPRKAESFVYVAQTYKAERLQRLTLAAAVAAVAALLLGVASLLWVFVLHRTVALRTAEIRRAKEKLEKAQHYSRIGSWTWDIKADRLEWSDEMYNIFGIDRSGFTGSLPDVIARAIHPDDREKVEASNESVARKGAPIPVEYRIIKPDGRIRTVWAEAGELVRDERGRPASLSGFVQDITERKAVEQDLQRSLAEKDALLAEVHHRVKNNLNVISSLLDLQALRLRTPDEALEAFKASRDRIKTMAAVHDAIYASKDFACVDLAGYIESLGLRLLGSFGAGDRVTLATRADEILLSVNESVPLALILHELITNALRHAFPGERRGRIDIRVSLLPNARRELTVADDGVGIAEEHRNPPRASLGLTIVDLLVKQLDGSLEIAREEGTRVTVQFPGKGCP